METPNSEKNSSRSVLEEIRKLEVGSGWSTGLFRFGFVVIFFEAISGIYLLVVNRWNTTGMMLLLGHIVVGLLMAVPCLMFALRHSKYSKVWQQSWFRILGLATAILLSLSLITGIVLALAGVTGNSILWWIHNLGSFGAVIGATAYLFGVIRLVVISLNEKSRAFVVRMVRSSVVKVGGFTALSIVAWALGGAFYQEPDPKADVSDYRHPFPGMSPFYPSQMTTSTGGFLKKEQLTGSRSCGTSGCHADILAQFEQSVHYRTPNVFVSKVADLLVQHGEEGKLFDRNELPHVARLRKLKLGNEIYRICAACHAPVALLTGDISRNKPLHSFESDEGDSCILCHAIDNASIFERRTINVTPPQRTLFWESSNPALSFLHRTLIKAKPEFHKKAFSKPSHKTSEYCSTCHLTLQYTSWAEGPYSGKHDKKSFKSCQDCHMKQVAVKDEVSGKVRGTVASHRFLSEGFTMAKIYGQDEQYKLTEEFLKDRKLSISVVAPSKVPSRGKVRFAVRIGNIGVGHSFPAGPEGDLVEAWAEVRITDETGRLVYEYGVPDKDGYLDDRKTEIYRILPFDAEDRLLPLDRHTSWRFAKDVLHVINPKEYDEIPFELKLPEIPSSRKLTIETRLRYRKPNQQFMDWVFGKGKVIAPIVDIVSASATADIERDPRVVASAQSAWMKEMRFPTGMDGLRKKDRSLKPPEKLRVAMEDRILIGLAYVLIGERKFHEARLVLDNLPALTQKVDGTLRARQALKQAMEKHKGP